MHRNSNNTLKEGILARWRLTSPPKELIQCSELLRGISSNAFLSYDTDLFPRWHDFLESHYYWLRRFFGYYEKIDHSDIEYASRLMHLSLHWLKSGIRHNQLHHIYAFCSSFHFFNISLEEVIEITELSPTLMPMVSRITSTVDAISFDLKITGDEDQSYSEHESYKLYVEGLKARDVHLAYQLVSGIELGNGFRMPTILEELIKLCSFLDIDGFASVINKKEEPTFIIFFIQRLTHKTQLCLLNHPFVSNCWLLFELMRQLSNEQIVESNLKKISGYLLAKGLLRLYSRDIDFCRKAIEFFQKTNLYIHFFYALGIAFALKKDNIINLYLDLIELSDYDTQLELNEFLMTGLYTYGDNSSINLLCVKLYYMWDKKIEEFRKSDRYLGHAYLSSYFYSVIEGCSFVFNNDSLFFDELNSVLDSLLKLDNEWHKSMTSYKTKFFSYFSKLWLLSIVAEHRKYNIKSYPVSYSLFSTFVLDTRVWVKFYQTCAIPSSIEQIITRFQM